jgi:GDP-D-mannose 3', 5'-epimerase
MKTALVLGAGGFIGSHMVKRLRSEGYFVRGVDLKYPEFSTTEANEFFIKDLRDAPAVDELVSNYGETFSEVYQFAADMGGAGYLFTGDHDADIMHNSAIINLNLLNSLVKLEKLNKKHPTVFYSSSACIYPVFNQEDPENPLCTEDSAYPASPDSEYGWEKHFSERLFFSYSRNYGIPVRVARFHNIFGPEGTWQGGKEKVPAAICRKVAQALDTIEVWGDGKQTRSFLFIDECIEAIRRLVQSDFQGPVNIGSEEMVTINKLVEIVCEVSNKKVEIIHVDGPTGVRGRNSDNTLIKKKLGWNYEMSLAQGIEKTYGWIESQIAQQNKE